MTLDKLQVPAFARLTDYCGLWAMHPEHFQFVRELVEVMDLAAHVEEGAEPIRAAMEQIAGPGGKSIAMIRATGLLMKSQSSLGGTSTIQLRREVRAAAADPNVAGILLAIDSPGGTVAGTDDFAKEVKAASRQKPVWAHIEDLGASAAYWVASQAQQITANSPTALVGSIGTVQVVRDFSAADEKTGVRTLVFATGPLKGIGMGGKVTEEQAAHLQGLVDSVQLSFDAAVQKGRGLNQTQLNAVRHGGAFTATEALDKKLIDGVQPLSKTINDFAAFLKSGGDSRRAEEATEPAAHGGLLPMVQPGLLPMLTVS